MIDENSTQQGQCQCGDTQFTIRGKPIVRTFCHCTICQEFNSAAYGDVTIFLSKDVSLHNNENVSFSKYKAPPAVQRGKCKSCNTPAIEFFDLPLFPSLTIIPSKNIPAGSFLPEASCHIFYHRRVSNISDDIPKYSGYIRSQVALSAKLLPSIIRSLVTP